MAWTDAVQAYGAGVHLLLEVSAGSKAPLFPAGYNAWRQRIGIAVQPPPRDGLANRAVIVAIAAFFCIAPAKVCITSGESDPRKTVFVAVAPETARAQLEAVLRGAS
jgi:uncharacterized protein (TIGR00251 family)